MLACKRVLLCMAGKIRVRELWCKAWHINDVL